MSETKDNIDEISPKTQKYKKAATKAGVKFRRLTSYAKVKLNNAKSSKEDKSVHDSRIKLTQTRAQIDDMAKIVKKLYNAKQNEYKYLQKLSQKLLEISPSTQQPKMIKGTQIDRDRWLNFINLIGETCNNMDTPYEILLEGNIF